EGGGDTASFFVYRLEHLPVATRVYLSLGGTATAPNGTGRVADYSGISFEPPTFTRTALSTAASAAVATPAAFGPIRPLAGGRPYVDIPANATFAEVVITPVDDSISEGDETAIFTIVSDNGYEIGTPNSATITIKDDDAVTLRATADTYVRDGANANTN